MSPFKKKITLIERIKWLIVIRWVALAGMLLAAHFIRIIGNLPLPMLPLYVIASIIALYNILFIVCEKLMESRDYGQADLEKFATVQIVFDLVAITFIVHFSGGVGSPFIFYFVLLMITTGTMLSTITSYLLATFAIMLFGSLVVLEYLKLIPHIHVIPFELSLRTLRIFNVGAVIVLASTLYFMVYSTNYLINIIEKKQEGVEELSALLEIGKSINSTLKLDDILDLILHSAIRITGTSAGSIALFDEENLEFSIRATVGFSEEFMHTLKWKVRPGGMTDLILKRRNPLVLEDALKEPTFNNPIALEEGIRSLIAVPLFVEEKIIGILYVDDFKPRTFSESEVRLVSFLATQVAIAINNAQLHEQTRWLAVTDGLTDVFNHRYFYEHLEKEMKRAERYNRPLSVIMMDIDYFKDYNDACGHKRGDDVLKQMAKMLIKTTRKFDVVARYGGDEFTIILPETDKTEALNIAERIRRDVEQYVFSFDDSPEKRYLTMSLGIATYPYDAGNVDELVDGADRALYKAKKRGRNRVCLFLNSPVV